MSKHYVGPYVNFQGQARAAMEFYQTVLGGTLDLMTLDKQGTPKPAGPGDRIAHARLQADGTTIIASDGHPDYPAKVGDAMGIALGCTDKDRLTRIFNGLADGGKSKMPLSRQPWGADHASECFGNHGDRELGQSAKGALFADCAVLILAKVGKSSP